MLGSTCSCLLALSLVILPPAVLHGQSDRVGSPPDSARDLTVDLAPTPSHGAQLPRPQIPIEPTRPRPVPPGVPPGTFALPQLAEAAGMIFSGTVTGVVRHAATSGQAMETVSITFHVENAIRGAAPGDEVTVRQWIGLWSGGQRYRIGERTLLFLYPPSKLGLTSCVGWPLGRFNLDPQGRVLLSAQQLSAFRRDPVLGGKSRVSFRDFALAVRQAAGEEWVSTKKR